MTDQMIKGSPSTGELVRRLSEDVSRLVRGEMRLAKLEMTQKGKRAGRGAGLFGGAGAMAFYGGAALVAAAILALALVLPGWASALIIGVLLLIVAAVLGMLGKGQVSQAAPPMPDRAIHGIKSDIEAATHKVSR
ncbi:membrane protein [Planotetraspora thailandica]|uniref:Membrane protein n=1 Tax=Planotetraspora thailandica TaxID=487172 RepID=A0A8J3XY36_9ACTN|nr:phage holin family protein [Planotetraspora thailandica]GII57454.1 membrane protein [Planotetraspora thailandica]